MPISEDIAFFVTVAMAAFAMLFGTRHIDTTEHQDGLMMAIAVESVVKLLAFLAVGLFITFAMMGGTAGRSSSRRGRRRTSPPCSPRALPAAHGSPRRCSP